jgi:hypothetical protein
MPIKISNDIGNRTRNLSACSAVPQPNAPPRGVAKGLMVYLLKTNIMVFTRKYKPEPTQALRVGQK